MDGWHVKCIVLLSAAHLVAAADECKFQDFDLYKLFQLIMDQISS